ncbi:MAG: alpha/beta hydrolase [Holophaga sp.]|nr:alpha/beta hydrolase [Holophaga sp.]
MNLPIILLITVLAVLLVAAAIASWLVWRCPITFYKMMARRSLKKSGLKQVFVPSPKGPQGVFVGGSGPVLMFLHGAGDHAGTWSRVVPALLRDYRLVIPDLAGHGSSAPATGLIEAADIVAGLEAVLESQPKDQPVTLVGNSLGGWMAMVLAQRHPERLERVIAVNGGALAIPPGPVNLQPRDREEARQTMMRLRDPDFPRIPDNVLDELVRKSRGGPLARFAATAERFLPWIMDEAKLGTITVPVFLLWGVADQLLTLDYAKQMLGALPNARLIPIDHCGHIPQQEAPGRFLEALGKALHQQTE